MSGEQTISYDDGQAQQVLQAWTTGTGHLVEGADAQAGLLALLVKAEMLAGKAGFAAPWDQNTAGTPKAAYVIGGAYAQAKARAAQGDPIAVLYLAAQQAARRAQAEITAAPATATPAVATEADALDIQPAALPIALIVIAVVAVAAAIAAVAWAISTKVTVEQQTQQRIALVNAALDTAASNNPNVKNNPKLWDFLTTMAGAETGSSSGPLGSILLIGAGLGIGALVWSHMRGDH